MQSLGKALTRVRDKAGSSPSRSNALAKQAKRDSEGVPVAYDPVDRLQDLIIWRSSDGEIETGRELTPVEREQIEGRAVALADALAPFERVAEIEAVIAAMWATWPQMRSIDTDSAAATVHFSAGALRRFPAWAIQRACMNIAGRNTLTKRDHRFPPSAAEVADEAERLLVPYQRAHRNLVDLLKSTPRRD